MSIQTGATIEVIPTDDLETDDYDFRGNDYGEVPIVCGNTVLTDERAIHARKKSLAHSREKINEADITTKRDTLDRHKERVNGLEASTVIQVPTKTDESKRDIIDNFVETNADRADKRLLSAILHASTHESVTNITSSKKFVMFELEDDTHIEATKHGDGIIIQRRGTHYGHEICRSFPEIELEETDVLKAVEEAIRHAT